MQTVLVTGATGFLGSHIVKALCASDYKVKALRRNSSSFSKLQGLQKQVEWLNTETSDGEALNRFFAGVDTVIHTATDYGRGSQLLVSIAETNTLYALKLLTAAINREIRLFINTDTFYPRETNAYSLSKAHFTEWGELLTTNKKTKFINIKLGHVYGPDDHKSKFVEFIIDSCMKNEPIIKLTTGEQERDFIYVSDVVDAYLLLLRKSLQTSKNFVTVPLGSGSVTSIFKLVKMIHRFSQSRSELRFGAITKPDNDVIYSSLDISVLKQLGWIPKISLEEGLCLTIESKKK